MKIINEIDKIKKTKSSNILITILNKHLRMEDLTSEEVELCAEKLYQLNKKDIQSIVILAQIKSAKLKNDEFVSLIQNAFQISKRNPIVLSLMAILYHDGYFKVDLFKAKKFAMQAEKYNKYADILVADRCNIVIANALLQKNDLTNDEIKEIRTRIYSISNKQQSFRLFKEYLKCELSLKTGFHTQINSALKYIEYVSPAIAESIKARACVLTSDAKLGDIKAHIAKFYQLLEKDNRPKSMSTKCLLSQCKSLVYLLEGLSYWSVDYGKKDAEKAIFYFKKSLELGNKMARYQIGFIYEDLHKYKMAYETYKEGYEKTNQIDENCLYYAADVCNKHPDLGLNKISIINLFKKSLKYGCNFASVRLGEIYRKSNDLIYARKMFQYAVDNIKLKPNSEEDLKIANKNLKEIDEIQRIQNNKADLLLSKLSSVDKTESEISEVIEEWFNKKMSSIPLELDSEVKNYLLLSINTATFYIRSGNNIDFSPCISSLSKAVENLLKNYFIEPYCFYLTENDVTKKIYDKYKKTPILLQDKFHDENHAGQIYFTMSDFKKVCKLECLKNSKYDRDFIKFLKTAYIVSDKSANLFIDKLIEQIELFRNKRDLATHCVPLSINDYEYCLNLLLLNNDALIRNILRKSK